MDAEQLHFPDFTAPDFTQPPLQRVDLTMPGFTMPDPERPEQVRAIQLSLWPDELDRPDNEQPDPASPDLMEPEIPAGLTLPDAQTHMLPEPDNAPDVVMQQRPGEMDPAAAAMLLASPDMEDLPARITYPQIYTSDTSACWSLVWRRPKEASDERRERG